MTQLPAPEQSTTVRDNPWRSLDSARCCSQRFNATLPQSKPSS